MPRIIPEDVVDLREYKKNNQLRSNRTIIISPFAAEANQTYLVGALPKNSYLIFTRVINPDNSISTDAAAFDLKVGDINDQGEAVALSGNTSMFGGDLFVTPAAAQNKGYLICYAETEPTNGYYTEG